ncbi:MAG: PHP domain-containing protein [Ruminococcaceae bacterium]|nr:PHP domain-containing protein [Oscillospiraceae bacterium]
MKYNYHTHTFRCHHASGTEEEYVQRAVRGGITHMGFSDHFPFRFPNGLESSFRVSVSEVPLYRGAIERLREKYKDQIDIRYGFEMEYYPEFFEEMRQNAIDYGAEYLILGQHFLKPECYPDALGSTWADKPNEEISTYASLVVDAIRSGAFTYVAHPDIYTYSGDPAMYDREMRRICVAARECNVPLEINFLGIRTNRFYPHDEFWRIAGEEGAPVVFGFDAHEVADACDDASREKAQWLVDTYHLNLQESVTLKPLK